MKKLVLIFTIMLGVSSIFAQGTATLRLEMPATAPLPGEDFMVGLWLDVLDYPAGVETIKSAQIGLEFDEANVTAVSTGAPFFKYYFNPNQMLTDYAALPATALPNAGDLRAVFYTTFAPGMDPAFYGGIPMKLWDYQFHYVGGDININFSIGNALKTVEPFTTGGKLETIETIVTSWDNEEYLMTFVDIISGPPPANTWLGITSPWFVGANWSTGAAPVAGDDVVIPTTANDPVIGLFVAECNTMQIDAGVTLTINDDGALTAYDVITNNGVILMNGDNIGASLIDNGFAGAGTFEYDRFLNNGPTGTNFGWHYVSSPVDNTVTGDFVGYWVKDFDEATGMFSDIDAFPGACLGSAFTVPMTSGMGYSVKQDLDYADECPQPTGATGDYIEFGGDFMSAYPTTPTAIAGMSNVNTGDVVVGLTGGGSNWNLMGNPYASGWDYDDWFFNGDFPAVGLWDAIYYWDGAAAAYASYVNGVGTNGGSNEVPPNQAFFLEADGTVASMPMTFENTARIHTVTPYYKSEVNDIVRLVASANGFNDETVIRFLDEATAGWDGHYDAKKLIAEGSEVPSLYTHAGIDMISINSQSAVDLVPMSFTCSISGTYEIEATETSEFSNVVLEDVLTGEQHDLLTGAYTFDYTAGENADRFIVHFTPLGTIENSFDNITIWSSENNIYVNVPMVTNGDIVVVNMMGQEVMRTDIAPGMNILPVDDANTYYVVQVIGSEDVKTGKVYIK